MTRIHETITPSTWRKGPSFGREPRYDILEWIVQTYPDLAEKQAAYARLKAVVGPFPPHTGFEVWNDTQTFESLMEVLREADV